MSIYRLSQSPYTFIIFRKTVTNLGCSLEAGFYIRGAFVTQTVIEQDCITQLEKTAVPSSIVNGDNIFASILQLWNINLLF